MRAIRWILPILMLALTSASAAAQTIRGRVIDDAARQGVARATVALVDSADGRLAEVVTGADGFFTLEAPGAGQFRIIVVHPGFAREERPVRVGSASQTVPAFVLKTEAVLLDAITAEGRRTAADSAAAAATFSRSSFVVAGSRLARLEQVGATMQSTMREMSGLRVREIQERTGRRRLCVESTRAIVGLSGGGGCNWVALIVDGVGVQDQENFFRSMRVADWESIEYVSPGDGAVRYGMDASARGAVVFWSRGMGPHRSAERNPPR
jgi:hypothetical protein